MTATYYDLLEVSTNATRSDIVQAYHRAKSAFAPDSLATYTLYSEEEATKIAARIETAFRVLVDQRKRVIYDQWLAAIESGEEVAPPDFGPTADELAARASAEEKARNALEEPSQPGRAPRSVGLPAPPEGSEQRVTDLLEGTKGCNGALIVAVREARGLTVEQISQATKISPMNLRFIEEDNYPSLPAPVYLRGFLAQIARCLHLDPDRVVEGYMTRFEAWKTAAN